MIALNAQLANEVLSFAKLKEQMDLQKTMSGAAQLCISRREEFTFSTNNAFLSKHVFAVMNERSLKHLPLNGV